MTQVLSDENSIIGQYLSELRDVEIQKDQARFSTNLQKLGMISAYELSKKLDYVSNSTSTPLGIAETKHPKSPIVIAAVLRAGLPVQQGINQVFDKAELAFIGAGRKPDTSHGVEVEMGYIAAPQLAGKTLILADTMLATGHSMLDAYNALVDKYGRPDSTYLVAVIASQQGVDFINSNLPDAELTVSVIDPDLNSNYFIVPGLGDAGDLLYGEKA